MAEATWAGFGSAVKEAAKEGFSNDVVKPSTYEAEITGARPQTSKDGETQRAIFVDFTITKGPDKGKAPSLRLSFPDPESDNFRGQSFHFDRKTAGFGDLDKVYAAMEGKDLVEALRTFCAGILGTKLLVEIVMGRKPYEERNDLEATKPLEAKKAKLAAVPEPEEEDEESEPVVVASEDDDEDPGF